MFVFLAKKLFGSSNDRIVKSFQPLIEKINSLEEEVAKLTDQELFNQTSIFRSRIENGEHLDSVLPEAFASVREASRRSLGLRHFDTQLIGGIVLHKGMIAEMKTGEGKTLMSTLAAYLNSLSGKGVHVVTPNDYLAKRDSEWMAQVYAKLGVSVGCIQNNTEWPERKAAYMADITYGTNNEFGFDYLRDNLKYSLDEMVQRPFHYAIVDEVDSILIDEARTPLIISGPSDNDPAVFAVLSPVLQKLNAEDFVIDEKARTASITDEGHEHLEDILKGLNILSTGSGLFDIENVGLLHIVNQLLKAHYLFKRDKDYIVQNKEIKIVDEFTGRIMDGRRFSEGLHQALEAKEKVTINRENQTLASITFQNYFRMYPKLSGMTGTAMTEAQEFADIYKLEVISIPTHQKVQRIDEHDIIFRTHKEKVKAMIEQIKEAHAKQQPVLVGTVSIERSETLSALLKKEKIPHTVLNALYHEQEAQIIAQAGKPGAVTIATNMAGRGTDIMLGGNPKIMLSEAMQQDKTADVNILKERIEASYAADKETVINAGGLLVIGTERHESRRIDNQLRGRSGRQGDPGRTVFYISLDDDLMRIFGSEKISSLLLKMGLPENEAVVHPWITKAIEKAQQKVEAKNYDARKNLLKFDDVMNEQRKVVYDQRIDVMSSESIADIIQEFMFDFNSVLIAENTNEEEDEQYDIELLEKEIARIYNIHLPLPRLIKEHGTSQQIFRECIDRELTEMYNERRAKYGAQIMNDVEKHIFIMTLDSLWREHLHTLDHLRTGIYLRSYAQKDPLNEYKMESFALFQKMLSDLHILVLQKAFHVEIRVEEQLHDTKLG